MNLVRIGNGSITAPGAGYTSQLSLPAQVRRSIGLTSEKVGVFYRDADSKEIIIRFENKQNDSKTNSS